MDYEVAKIAKVTGKCPACEEYAEKNATTPPKIAVMACEGACARGEVARLISLSSYLDNVIWTAVETWADAVPALA